ncbi:MAG: hypothetical protein GXO12_06610 [Epsilonproteobacteria bacterium]|nr:hypothetical protein [Campylobacterota bacterium]
MIKRFKIYFFIVLSLVSLTAFSGCDKKDPTKPAKMHWDRDMCERCKMAISERKYAVQIVNPANGKHYEFDDIGCAVLWMDEEHIPWKDKAVIWITDAKTGKWIDAKKAMYTDDSITPMAYGIAAYTKETFPKGKKSLTFDEAKKVIYKIEEFNKKKQEEELNKGKG